MTKNKKNKIVLALLFFGPLLFYLFLLTGTNNFAKLPRLTSQVGNVDFFKSDQKVNLENKISILCFFGKDLLLKKTNALNLNEKIYKHFYGFKDFQFVIILPNGSEDKANELKKELGATTDIDKWFFVFGTDSQIKEMFDSLQTNYKLDADFYTPNAFIVDRNMNLRGRNDDEDEPDGFLYGYNAETVAPIHQKMVDDLKIVIAEYRLALKRNNNLHQNQ